MCTARSRCCCKGESEAVGGPVRATGYRFRPRPLFPVSLMPGPVKVRAPVFPRFPPERGATPFRSPVSAVRRRALSVCITLPSAQVGAHPRGYSTARLSSTT
ncbi:hypothetical protein GCM10009801_35240 [Streptomyces albiaxialis]|uniref:Uncharacterized protein n=1 Tax=Streptomyces albiaxialis TaxID=329523 RepID=A0ABN2VZI9_9ACTN